MTVKGTFEMDILPDGHHANMKMDFEQPLPEHADKWLRFAFCNDLMWTIHAMAMNGTDVWMSTITMDLYRHFLQHVSGDQYLVRKVRP